MLRAHTAAEKHLNDAGTDRPAWCAWVCEADLAVDSGRPSSTSATPAAPTG
ncbi:hypothetical protein ACWCPX_34375 [Streptomyces olivaceoviridis]